MVVLDHWSHGRIALVGDAAYCPSVMTGMGTSCGITGAYVLAGEITTHCGNLSAGIRNQGNGTINAFNSYENEQRRLIDHIQKGLTDNPHYVDSLPPSEWGIGMVYILFLIASFLRLDDLAPLGST